MRFHSALAHTLGAALVALGCAGAEPASAPDNELCAPQLQTSSGARILPLAEGLISQRALGGVTPELALDGAGNRLVVYRDDVPTGRGAVILRRRPAAAAAFEAGKPLSDTADDCAAPTLAVQGDHVLVVWAQRGKEPGVYGRVSNDASMTFGPPFLISDDVSDDARPRAAMDAEGQWALVWDGGERTDEEGPVRPLLYARSRPSSEFSVETMGDVRGIGRPALALAGDGSAVIAWSALVTQEGGHAVMVARAGASAGPQEWLSEPFELARETTSEVALTADGEHVFLAFSKVSTAAGAAEPLGLALLRSSDNGLTFEALGSPTESATQASRVSLAPSGALWLLYRECSSEGACHDVLERSQDQGATFELARQVEAEDLSLAAITSDDQTLVLAASKRSGLLHDITYAELGGAEVGEISASTMLTAYDAAGADAIGADATRPAVAGGADGDVLVAYAAEASRLPSTRSGIFFVRSSAGGRAFDSPLMVAPNAPAIAFDCQRETPEVAARASDARVAIDSGADDIAVAWADEVVDPSSSASCSLGSPTDVFVSRSANGGRSFSEPVNVSRSTRESTAPSLAHTAGGNLALAWSEQVETALPDCSNTTLRNVLLSLSEGADFSAPLNISAMVLPDYCGDSWDPVLLSSHDALEVAFRVSSTAGSGSSALVIARSEDGGRNFTLAGRLFEADFAA
ncbi:MAG TPA: hypothetical protein VEX18_11610, partial [Polyangiaceae bacterium]|nr:hypothetical protein [Polyangiaceae bacterium]